MAGMGGIADIAAGISQGKKNVRARRFEDADERRRESAEERRVAAEGRADQSHTQATAINRLQIEQGQRDALHDEQKYVEGPTGQSHAQIMRGQEVTRGQAQIDAFKAQRKAANDAAAVSRQQLDELKRKFLRLKKQDDAGLTDKREKQELATIEYNMQAAEQLWKSAKREADNLEAESVRRNIKDKDGLTWYDRQDALTLAGDQAQIDAFNAQQAAADRQGQVFDLDIAQKKAEAEPGPGGGPSHNQILMKLKRDTQRHNLTAAEQQARNALWEQNILFMQLDEQKNVMERTAHADMLKLYNLGFHHVIGELIGEEAGNAMHQFNLYNISWKMTEDPVKKGTGVSAKWHFKIQNDETKEVKDISYTWPQLGAIWMSIQGSGEDALNKRPTGELGAGGVADFTGGGARFQMDEPKIADFRKEVRLEAGVYIGFGPGSDKEKASDMAIGQAIDFMNRGNQPMVAGQVAREIVQIINEADKFKQTAESAEEVQQWIDWEISAAFNPAHKVLEEQRTLESEEQATATAEADAQAQQTAAEEGRQKKEAAELGYTPGTFVPIETREAYTTKIKGTGKKKHHPESSREPYSVKDRNTGRTRWYGAPEAVQMRHKNEGIPYRFVPTTETTPGHWVLDEGTPIDIGGGAEKPAAGVGTGVQTPVAGVVGDGAERPEVILTPETRGNGVTDGKVPERGQQQGADDDGMFEHYIGEGDTLEGIAQYYGTTVAQLIAANDGLIHNDDELQMSVGLPLDIPISNIKKK